MARLQLNKSSLAKQNKDLQSFVRYLPSLDLKRQQLMLEKGKVGRQIQSLTLVLQDIYKQVQQALPMMANPEIELAGLVKIVSVQMCEENVVGVHLPQIEQIDIQVTSSELLARPHWVDNYVKLQRKALECSLQLEVEHQREVRLLQAVKTITQRVNLFEKVLIPKAKDNIKKIKVALSDEQMAAVVRSKIAKKKRQASGEIL